MQQVEVATQITDKILTRVDGIGEVLKALATKMGTTAEHLWPSLVTREVAQAWAVLGLWGLTLLVNLGLWWKFGKMPKRDGLSNEWPLPTCIMAMATGLLSVILAVSAAASFPDTIGTIVAPEAAALQTVLRMLPR